MIIVSLYLLKSNDVGLIALLWFSKGGLVILDFLNFHMNFNNSLSIFIKKSAGISICRLGLINIESCDTYI